MTAVALTAAQIAPCFPDKAEIIDVVTAEAVTKGNALYQTTSGTFGIADANASGKQQFRGIALETVGSGQAVSMLKKGHCYGFTVSALNADAILYLSDTAGSLDTAAGTMTVNCGRVTALTDSTPTLVVYIDADWLRAWS
jgi:hypothetical protein